MHPYWYFVPLGRLSDGPYSVSLRLANDESLITSTTADLRAATKEEIEARSQENHDLQMSSNKHFERKKQNEQEHGAALQLRLERLAEFVHTAEVAEEDRQILARDVERLGEAVDWNQDIYRSYRYHKNPLAPPTPGYVPQFQARRFPQDFHLPNSDQAKSRCRIFGYATERTPAGMHGRHIAQFRVLTVH
jgi:hypothetical protein